MRTRKRSFSDTGTTTVNPPSGSTSTGVIAPVVTLTILTVSRGLAEPCVARTVVRPCASGTAAVMAPAGGGGGGAVSSERKEAWNARVSP